jgi:hypothetical protein
MKTNTKSLSRFTTITISAALMLSTIFYLQSAQAWRAYNNTGQELCIGGVNSTGFAYSTYDVDSGGNYTCPSCKPKRVAAYLYSDGDDGCGSTTSFTMGSYATTKVEVPQHGYVIFKNGSEPYNGTCTVYDQNHQPIGGC